MRRALSRCGFEPLRCLVLSLAGETMRRRDFITLIGSVAVCPMAARAQQSPQARRVGVLVGGVETDPDLAARLVAFQKALQELGWSPGTNLQADVRFGVGDDNLSQKANELIGLRPDVVFAMSSSSVATLRKVTRSVMPRRAAKSGSVSTPPTDCIRRGSRSRRLGICAESRTPWW